MNMLILIAFLAGSCVATPIQPQPQEGRQFRDEIRNSDGIVYGKYGFQDPSGGLRIVKYTAGKDGLTSQVDGVPGVPVSQPIVWNQNEPIYIEPAPLTYGSVKSEPFLTERDQQRYLNIDESLEAREEDYNPFGHHYFTVNDEVKPVNEQPAPVVDSKDDVKVDNQKQVVNEQQPSLLVSGISPVNIQRQVLTNDDQIFPQVITGQRRLVEPIPQQQYAVKGRSQVSQVVRPIFGYGSPVIPQKQVVYQTVQHGLPISIEEHRVSSQGVRRPTVQYQLKPVQQRVQQVQQVSQLQSHVPQEWVRKPSYQVSSGVKGSSPRNYQYFIQPVIPQPLSIEIQRQQVQQPVQQQQQVPQVLNIEQQVPVVDQRRDIVDQKVVVHDSHVGHDVDHRPLHVVQEVPKSEILSQQKQVVKSPVVSHLGDQRIVYQETGRQVPVVNGQRIIGYQIGSQIPQQQQIVYPQVQQYGQYVPQTIPVSDLQQYYSVISQNPVQSYDQYVPYFSQNPSINTQPIQYTPQIEQPIQYGVQGQQVDQEQPIQYGPVQGVQQVRVQEDLSVNNRGQDIRINPLSVDQRVQQRPTILINSGVKSAINV